MKHIEWIFSGIGVLLLSVIGGMIKKYIGRKKNGTKLSSIKTDITFCIDCLSNWMDQLRAVFTHLHSQLNYLQFQEFDDVLEKLRMQSNKEDLLYIRDHFIRDIIQRSCPEFDQYYRIKAKLKQLANSSSISTHDKDILNKFLSFTENVEKKALEVKNPCWYDAGHPARKEILTEAVETVNRLRFELQSFREID